jgi:hypothetical protein
MRNMRKKQTFLRKRPTRPTTTNWSLANRNRSKPIRGASEPHRSQPVRVVHSSDKPTYRKQKSRALCAPGGELDRFAGRELLKKWFHAFDDESRNFSSPSVFAQIKLQEALKATVDNPLLEDGHASRSWVRTAVSLELIKRLRNSEIFSKYRMLLDLIYKELSLAIYSGISGDDSLRMSLDDLCYAKPFFTLVHECQGRNFALNKTIEEQKKRIEELTEDVQVRIYKDRQNNKLLSVVSNKLNTTRLKTSFKLWNEWCTSRLAIKSKLSSFLNRNNTQLLAITFDGWALFVERSAEDKKRIQNMSNFSNKFSAILSAKNKSRNFKNSVA